VLNEASLVPPKDDKDIKDKDETIYYVRIYKSIYRKG
jgi:hypothetical protein